MDDKLQPRQQDTTGQLVSYWLNSDNRIVRVSKLWKSPSRSSIASARPVNAGNLESESSTA